MNFIISANTDVGIAKDTNQDSLSVMVLNTPQGKMAFSILCDGMGGLAMGEVASAAVINAFRRWVYEDLPKLCNAPLEDVTIRSQWEKIIQEQNQLIKNFGARQGIRLGTTVVAVLLTQNRYYVLNVGDSRAYEITNCLRQITSDQTFVAREIALGHMTPEEALVDPRRNVLLQCVGATKYVQPVFIHGKAAANMCYMLCSDGYRHEVTRREIGDAFKPTLNTNEVVMKRNISALVELNIARGETDNISALLIRTI